MNGPRAFLVQRDSDDALIIIPQRSITSLAEDEAFTEMEDLLLQVEKDGIKIIIVDFKQSSYVASTMLEALRAVSKKVLSLNGGMALCNVSDVAREILRLVKFETRWPIHSTREKALKAMRE